MTKTPTKAELQRLAVRALGEGVQVKLYGPSAVDGEYEYSACLTRGQVVSVWHAQASTAARALAAALRALAGE